jgi:hypothetical protein
MLTRREALGAALGLAAGCAAPAARRTPAFRLATFCADVTPPLGHPLLAGLCPPAKETADPLEARGFVLAGSGAPVVVACVDWCEIRNEAHDRWRARLAEAAETTPDRVLVSSVHPHDAPLADLEADRILRDWGLPGRILDADFHERAVRDAAAAVREGLRHARPVTHLGIGRSRVREVASNRRTLAPDGRPRHDRMSACADPELRARPEGTIDPWLRTISFWEDGRPLAALSAYATHPMSYYRTGRVSADFPGMARRRREEQEGVFQIYGSGASGNVAAGKYNDGSPAMRPVLAGRLHAAMSEAWRSTVLHRLDRAELRAAPLPLAPRFTREELESRFASSRQPDGSVLAALGLSWRGRALDLPVLDLGAAAVVLLPAESYVEYQLLAQALRPDALVLTLGYGDCAPGYIPTERHWDEGDSNLRDWCWVARGAERLMTDALRSALRA